METSKNSILKERSVSLPASTSDRQGFNKRWYADDAGLIIHRPQNSNDVLEAFQYALNAGISPSQLQLTCGRHCYEGFVYNSNTKQIIDLTGLKEYGETTLKNESGQDTPAVYLDVGMGNWDAFRLLNNVYQKLIPAGSCFSVGLGGHITGGGYGVFSRLYGLTVDYLIGADIVVRDKTSGNAKLLTGITKAPTDENKDLMWGLQGGGGGQFGIITRLYFDKNKLPNTPEYVYIFTFTWSWYQDAAKTKPITLTQFTDIINFFEQNMATQMPVSWKSFGMLHANHKEADVITLPAIVTYDDSFYEGDHAQFIEELEGWVTELRAKAGDIALLVEEDHKVIGHPYITSIKAVECFKHTEKDGITESSVQRAYTFLEAVQNISESGPNRYGKYKSAYHTTSFSPTMVNAMYNYLQQEVKTSSGVKCDMSQSLIQIDAYGCKINTVDPGATAIAQRSSIMKLQYQTYWNGPFVPGEQDPLYLEIQTAQVNWINNLYAAVYAKSTNHVPDGTTTEPDGTGGTDGCYFNYCDIYIGSREAGTPALNQAWSLYFRDNESRLAAIATAYNEKGWFGNSQTFSP